MAGRLARHREEGLDMHILKVHRRALAIGVLPLVLAAFESVAVFALLAAAGCGEDSATPGDNGDGEANSDAPNGSQDTAPDDAAGDGQPSAPSTTLVAFNVGLAPNFVPYSTERVPLVASALSELQADVVCLTELWLQSDRNAILQATNGAFPHSYFHVTEEEIDENAEAACAAEEASALFDCVNAACTDTPDLVGCVLANYGAEFGALSTGCLGCVSANVSKPLGDIFALCTGGTSSFAYGGHNGLLLLSRLPLQDATWTALDSSLVQRAALSARTSQGLGVICTHLAADLSAIQPYTGPYDSFEAEQRLQI
jgi:hypothetical protein